MVRSRAALACLVLGLGLTACAPSITPLYRDYEVRATLSSDVSNEGEVFMRIRSALTEAGWTEAPADAPTVVSTEPRTVSDWGLSRTEVSLDVAPIGDRFVRVYFHPVRYSALGGRTKVPYLNSGVRRALLPDLNEALAAQGFVVLGTPRERDEETVES
ncbi:MAG: hypothetical protein HKN04_05970 [Rhodothermaceae bacterium]|nr:hypothetical protein [Rhodothermaceae bacterium]